MTEDAKPVTVETFRREVKAAYRSLAYAEHIVCRAMNRTYELKKLVDRLHTDAVLKAAMIEIVQQAHNSVSEAYRVMPSFRIRELKRLLGENEEIDK